MGIVQQSMRVTVDNLLIEITSFGRPIYQPIGYPR
jgi:hypothetical protein